MMPLDIACLVFSIIVILISCGAVIGNDRSWRTRLAVQESARRAEVSRMLQQIEVVTTQHGQLYQALQAATANSVTLQKAQMAKLYQWTHPEAPRMRPDEDTPRAEGVGRGEEFAIPGSNEEGRSRINGY